METKDWIAIAGILIVAVTGFMWLGAIGARVDNIENTIVALESGPRGRSCEHMVSRLSAAIESNNERAQRELERLAGNWGCATMIASHEVEDALEAGLGNASAAMENGQAETLNALEIEDPSN